MSPPRSVITYPRIPKTTANMKPGEFWGIPLESGRYGCGVVLDVESGSRTGLIVGLTDFIGFELPTEESLKGCKLVDQGEVHLKSILRAGKTILGRVALDDYGLQPILMRDSNDLARGCVLEGYRHVRAQTRADLALPVRNVWGYMIIAIKANKLEQKKPSP